MQQMLMLQSQRIFDQEINHLMMDGWRIVPGTFSASSHRVVAGPNDDPRYVLPDGTTYRSLLAAVLERDDVT